MGSWKHAPVAVKVLVRDAGDPGEVLAATNPVLQALEQVRFCACGVCVRLHVFCVQALSRVCESEYASAPSVPTCVLGVVRGCGVGGVVVAHWCRKKHSHSLLAPCSTLTAHTHSLAPPTAPGGQHDCCHAPPQHLCLPRPLQAPTLLGPGILRARLALRRVARCTSLLCRGGRAELAAAAANGGSAATRPPH